MAPDPQSAALVAATIGFNRQRPTLVWSEVHWPTPLDPEACLAVLRQVAADRVIRTLAIELEVTSGRIEYRIGAPAHTADRIAQLLDALVPGIVLTRTGARPDLKWSWNNLGIKLCTRPIPSLHEMMKSPAHCKSLRRARRDTARTSETRVTYP